MFTIITRSRIRVQIIIINDKEIYTAIEALHKAAPEKANWVECNKSADCGEGNSLIETNKKRYTFKIELKKNFSL